MRDGPEHSMVTAILLTVLGIGWSQRRGPGPRWRHRDRCRPGPTARRGRHLATAGLATVSSAVLDRSRDVRGCPVEVLRADIWERGGSDPSRVRVTREYANAYRLYAKGLGDPTGSAKFRAALAGPEPRDDRGCPGRKPPPRCSRSRRPRAPRAQTRSTVLPPETPTSTYPVRVVRDGAGQAQSEIVVPEALGISNPVEAEVDEVVYTLHPRSPLLAIELRHDFLDDLVQRRVLELDQVA